MALWNRARSSATRCTRTPSASPTRTGSRWLESNVVYANTNTGIRIEWTHTAGADRTLDNTVYQVTGDAIRVQGSATNVFLQNNILFVGAGNGIFVINNSQTGFQSDWNLFDLGAGANVGNWNGAALATIAAWRTAVPGRDQNSLTGQALFLDINGADNVFGEQGVATGNGDDDNFGLKKGSAAIDRANAYVASLTDIERPRAQGRPRYGQRGQRLGSLRAVGHRLERVRRRRYGDSAAVDQLGLDRHAAVRVQLLRHDVHLDAGVDQRLPALRRSGHPDQHERQLAGRFQRNVRIAPLWDNLDHGRSQPARNIFVTSSATEMTVRWAARSEAARPPEQVNFSVTLFATATSSFNYGAGNQSLTPTVGLSAGNGFTFVLAPGYDGQADLNAKNGMLWTPTPGLVYYDIGAYEFQGDSGDNAPRRSPRSSACRRTAVRRRTLSPASRSPSARRSTASARAARRTTASSNAAPITSSTPATTWSSR